MQDNLEIKRKKCSGMLLTRLSDVQEEVGRTAVTGVVSGIADPDSSPAPLFNTQTHFCRSPRPTRAGTEPRTEKKLVKCSNTGQQPLAFATPSSSPGLLTLFSRWNSI